MTEARRKNDYEQWVKFFLLAVYESAEDAIDTIDKLAELHERSEKAVLGMGRASKTALRLLRYLERNPIIEIRKTAVALEISFTTASVAVNRLVEAGILHKTKKVSRNRTFAYSEYLEFLRRDT